MLGKKEKLQPYHHGNVKEALIDTATKLIESIEVELLSLRLLAKEVGIAPSAVYNHFPDKNTLMLSIKLRLYDEFNKFFEVHSSRTKDPEQGLLDICLTYYYFSQEYPSKFHFLFGSPLPTEWSTREMIDISCNILVKTRKVILEIYDKYKVPCDPCHAVNSTVLIWAQLNGIVALKKTGSIKATVTHQDWPEACSLVTHEQVEGLIRIHLNMTINAILNSQHSTNRH